MKLFVWDNPYKVPYGASLLFVVAETEDEARTLAANGKGYSYGFEQEGSKMDGIPLGAPSRVLDLPCAEWHEWSE